MQRGTNAPSPRHRLGLLRQRCICCLQLAFEAGDELSGGQSPLTLGEVEVTQFLKGGWQATALSATHGHACTWEG